MGPSGTTAGQLALAFARLHPGGTNTTEPLGNIATYYIEEGNAAGVRGDIAFAQGILETGWFMYGGQVQPNQNNFAGIRNADGVGFASFGSARLGVRAQIQHLRRYADPAASCAPPANVDPRCSLVTPGIAPTWQQLDGKWAVPGTGYGNRIIGIYNDLRAAVGLPPI
jgi:Mannosyl-glycoprotein endo-beta-N-acetylglucosaminidase